MTPERWRQVREALHGAAGKDRAARADFLCEICGEDIELREEVERLLAALDRSGSFLEPPSASAPKRPGAKIGPYLLLEQAGQGGMGTVYRAVREDDYRLQVALKLVKAESETECLLERFRQERQALALLNHPNIARLLDGGTTADGRPYLVMEWVQGSPITDHCAARSASLRDRLGLFLCVCRAVAHAHANLVVHRDLKPSNIFITEDGVPKLLDFGIARILSPQPGLEAAPLTLAGARALTPDYASPEQVRGEPINTATDIYSLGAVLYELLTGVRPHRFDTRTPQEIERVVCARDVARPSTVAAAGGVSARELSGDLDNIVLKAMDKDPARRYSHAEAFAEDIRRHLEGRPVSARASSFQYRALKFARRNKTLVFTSAAVALSLAIALAVALREARVARLEGEVAERRFDLARRAAASLMYDVHDQIQDLAGSTKAREFLLRKSLDYLDALSKESTSSPALQRDLASAYRRVATLQGVHGVSNLGQPDAARESLRKAQGLLENALRSSPRSVELRRDLAATHREFVAIGGEPSDLLRHAEASLAIVETLRAERPDDRALLIDLHNAEFYMGSSLTRLGRYAEAIVYRRRALSHGSESDPANLSLDHRSLGGLLIQAGALDEALTEYRAAAAIDEDRVRREPDSGRARLDLSYSYADWALILTKLNRPAEAVGKYREAEELRAGMAARDPHDARAASGLVSVEWRMAFAMAKAGDPKGAEAAFGRAVRDGERMIATLPDPKTGQAALAEACWNFGLCYKDIWGSCSKAKPWLSRARQLYQELNQPTSRVEADLAACTSAQPAPATPQARATAPRPRAP